jgi:hypothetical protein
MERGSDLSVSEDGEKCSAVGNASKSRESARRSLENDSKWREKVAISPESSLPDPLP